MGRKGNLGKGGYVYIRRRGTAERNNYKQLNTKTSGSGGGHGGGSWHIFMHINGKTSTLTYP